MARILALMADALEPGVTTRELDDLLKSEGARLHPLPATTLIITLVIG